MPRHRSAWILAAAALAWAAPPAARAIDFEATVGLSGGFRSDRLESSGDSCACDRQKLKYSDTQVDLLQVHVRARLAKLLYLRGIGELGSYANGDFGIDVDGDDGPGPQPYRIRGDVNGDDVLGGSLGLGFQLGFFGDRLRVAPLAGYSYDEQNIKSTNEKVTVFDDVDLTQLPIDLPEFERVKWNTEWKGPWAGIDLSFEPLDKLLLHGFFEYHWTEYDGKIRLTGTQSIPGQVVDQSGDGRGLVWGFAGQYSFFSWLTVHAHVRFQDWHTDVDTPFGDDNVDWDAVSFTGGLLLPF